MTKVEILQEAHQEAGEFLDLAVKQIKFAILTVTNHTKFNFT